MTPSLIVDPTNDNIALLDGRIVYAMRAGNAADPKQPTAAEVDAMPIIGYSNKPTPLRPQEPA